MSCAGFSRQICNCGEWKSTPPPHHLPRFAPEHAPIEDEKTVGVESVAMEAADVEESEREKIPLGRRGRPDDVARWILNVADPASDWVTGQVIDVDGGLGLA